MTIQLPTQFKSKTAYAVELFTKADRLRLACDSQTKPTITLPAQTKQIPRHARAT